VFSTLLSILLATTPVPTADPSGGLTPSPGYAWKLDQLERDLQQSNGVLIAGGVTLLAGIGLLTAAIVCQDSSPWPGWSWWTTPPER
jgi:hypothetical protein